MQVAAHGKDDKELCVVLPYLSSIDTIGMFFHGSFHYYP